MVDHTIIKLIKESGHLPYIPKEFGEILTMLLEPMEYDLDQCVEKFGQFPQLEEFFVNLLNYKTKLTRDIRTIKDAIKYLGAQNSKTIAISSYSAVCYKLFG